MSISSVRSWIRGHRWRALTLWIILFTAINMWSLRELRQQASEGQQARDAICTLKLDLIERVRSQNQFLEEHPSGIPGVSVKVLQRSIDGQQRTIDALKIRCRS